MGAKKLLLLLSSVFALSLTACGSSNNNGNGGGSDKPSEPTHTHKAGTPVEENKVEPTCTKDGSYDLVTYCVDDHEEMSREHKTIPALSHDYQRTTTPPTYESDGVITYTCSRCGDVYTEKGEDRLEHHYSSDWSHNETSHWHACTDEGYESLKTDESSHTYNDVVTEPTYEAGGYTTHTCTVCGYSYTDGNTSKLEHHYSSTWTYNETTHWHTCTDEGYESLKSDELEHTFNDVITNPTYENDGYTTHTCSVCGYSFIDTHTNKLPITITWKNYDGSILETDENVSYGSSPSYDGTTPTRPNYDVYSYTFKGWSPEVKEVTEPVTYIAQYEQEKVAARLTITYALMDPKTDKAIQRYNTLPAEIGEISSSQIYDFNTNVDLSAKMNEGYIFLGWYYQNTLVSNNINYSYVIWDEDASIEARFCYKTYDLRIYSNSSENGLVLLKYSYTRTYKEIYYGDTSVTVSVISETIENKEVRANYQTTYDYKSQVSVAAFSQTGVRFLGWYDTNNQLVSTKAVYTFNMPNKDYTLEAKWDHFNVSYNLNGGTNNENNPSTFSIDDGIIELNNPTRTGYNFMGWKLNGEPVTSIDTSLVKDITLDAVWEAEIYSINYQLNGGTNNEDNPSVYNIEDSTITLSNPTRTGYNFAGWYLDSEFNDRTLSIQHGSYGNINLYAKWEAIVYTITYNLYGGVNNENNPSTYTIEDSVTLSDPTREGYSFASWYDSENNPINSIELGTYGDLTLNANWSPNMNILSVTSEDEAKGTVSIISGSGYSGESITVAANPIGDNIFKGWYHDSVKVSEDKKYTFLMPASDYSLEACFTTKAEAYGMSPIIDLDNKTVTYGLYPQDIVDDEELVTALNDLDNSAIDSNGWYLYENEYYAKLVAKPYSSNCFFDNGEKIESDATYWFKCKPIIWNLLNGSNGVYYLLSRVLLDIHNYNETYEGYKNGHYANNYVCSGIREWLNGDFYNSAFALHNEYVRTTEVDNTKSTTNNSSVNHFASGYTEDKVFLLSHKDYRTSSYGFDTLSSYESTTRYCKTTDWARAKGLSYSHDSKYLYNGYYWTRSPYSDGSIEINTKYSMDASMVDYNGKIIIADVGVKAGTRPAISLFIS